MTESHMRLFSIFLSTAMAIGWLLIGDEHGATAAWSVGTLILANLPKNS